MSYQFPNSVLMIFCKAPIPGQVKTRLTPSLTDEQATQIHIELSEKTFSLATEKKLCPVQIWCSPSIEHPFFVKTHSAWDVSLKTQQGTDLGQRMLYAFKCALKQFDNAVIIGCDCPSLKHSDLEQAFIALNTNHPITIAPAEDGGYVLIGLNRLEEQLFSDIPWGTSEVLSITKSRINATRLDCLELQQQYDIDTIEDLKRYQNQSKIFIS